MIVKTPSMSISNNPEEELLTRRCFERALDMYEALKTAIANSELVRLAPRQTITQHSTMLLVNGSLVQSRPLPRVPHHGKHHHHHHRHHHHSPDGGQSGQPSTQPQSTAVPSLPVYKPPGLIMWLPDFFEYGIAKYFRRSENVTFTAGPTGAALLVCEVSDVAVLLNSEAAGDSHSSSPSETSAATPASPHAPHTHSHHHPTAASNATSPSTNMHLGAAASAPPMGTSNIGAGAFAGGATTQARGQPGAAEPAVFEVQGGQGSTTEDGTPSPEAAAAAAKATVSGLLQRAKSTRWNV